VEGYFADTGGFLADRTAVGTVAVVLAGMEAAERAVVDIEMSGSVGMADSVGMAVVVAGMEVAGTVAIGPADMVLADTEAADTEAAALVGQEGRIAAKETV